MNNEQCAHLWANQSRESARGSHFFFEGDTVYSYGSHFPIARHYKGVILFTSKSYSVSTARHISITRQACNHIKSFSVANPLSKPSGKDVKEYAAQIADMKLELARARDPQWKLESLERAVNEANEFCAMFGFKTRFAMPDESELAVIKERSKVDTANKAKATAAKNARIELENAESIQKWLAGEQVSLPYSISKVYLRTNACYRAGEKSDLPSDAVMQTSKGATVPLAEAQKAFRFCIIKRTTGWHRNGDTFKVGEFQLDAINGQGVVAGCHLVEWNEIERFAKTQGWTK